MPAAPFTPAQREAILALASQYGVGNMRLFGSRARGDAEPESDYDFLFDAPPHLSLFKIFELQEALEHFLGAKVDLVEEAAIRRPALKQYMLMDARPV